MLSRNECKKGSGPGYDPQVAANAAAQTALAERTQKFTEDYYNKYITPLLDQQSKLATTADKRESDMFDMNMKQMKTADDRYQKYGIPAETAYYDMVKNYSSTDEEQKQAEGAIGDQRVAAQGQQKDQQRRMAGLGIDPTSPAYLAAMSDNAVQNSALEAAASTKARAAAKGLGMQLTQDAANFGRGGASTILGFGQAASGNTAAGLGANSAALQGANAGAGTVLAGAGVGLKAYGSNLDTYGSLQKTQMGINAQAAAGLGNFLGTVAGAAIPKYSDRRLKKNVTLMTTLSNGIGVYEFHYLWEDNAMPKRIGYMADEVETRYPDAVTVNAKGFKQVDYSKVTV